ncbi:sigma factor [Streptomyces anulatus]|uniref:RNA polymerase sigma factor n=1 Tax=Streptomyces anulatus TaxID=1892 RepID=UPI0033E7EF49
MHARIRAGDPDAFRELFRDHAQLVFRHAVRTTGDWSAAEDVVSLTFLEAWRLRGKLRDEGESPRPWLMGIAVNVPVGTVRSRLSRARARLRKLTDSELRRRGGGTEPGVRGPGGRGPGGTEPCGTEPGGSGGQVQGGRAAAARSNEERTR